MAQQVQSTAEAPDLVTVDDSVFQGLYEQYNRPIYYFFANRGFPREESRDLVQETFLAAYGSRAGFRGDSSAAAWLFGIATNIWRMRVRRNRRLKHDAKIVSLDEPAPGGENARSRIERLASEAPASPQLERCLADEEFRMLYVALQELPEKMRLCMILHLRDYKYREIAEILRVSINTVRSQLFDAREKLGKMLTDHFSDLSPLDSEGTKL